MLLGSTNGSVDSEQLRTALVEAEVEPKRMKAVLRSLEEQGISITLDTAHATRAVAATSSTRRTASASTKKAAVKKTAVKKAPAAGEEGPRRSEEGRGQDGRRPGEEDCRQEGHHHRGGVCRCCGPGEEGRDQEDRRQEDRRGQGRPGHRERRGRRTRRRGG